MDAPRRIVVLDDDARVRQLIQSALRPPDFEVFAFGDGRDALMKLHEIRPDLILSDVWMPDVDGRLFLQVVKRSPTLRDVPFVFLTAVAGETAIDAAMQAGADGFLMKPFPVTMLREKVRAMLDMPLAGSGGRALPASAPAPSATPLDAATLVMAAPPEPAPAPPEPAPEAWESDLNPPRLNDLPSEIEGCFTMTRVGERRIPVLTEAENRPNFTITTLMTQGGRPIRKIETTWQHPLERHEDLASARQEVRLQHEQALATVAKLGQSLTPRRVVWDPDNRLVDGSLLCWAVSAVVEEVRSRVGREPALNILRLTYERQRRSLETLRVFRIEDDGRVLLNPNGGGLVHQPSVVASAEWAVGFVKATRGMNGESTAITIRRATAARSIHLDRVGWYGAVTGAVQRMERDLPETRQVSRPPRR